MRETFKMINNNFKFIKDTFNDLNKKIKELSTKIKNIEYKKADNLHIINAVDIWAKDNSQTESIFKEYQPCYIAYKDDEIIAVKNEGSYLNIYYKGTYTIPGIVVRINGINLRVLIGGVYKVKAGCNNIKLGQRLYINSSCDAVNNGLSPIYHFVALENKSENTKDDLVKVRIEVFYNGEYKFGVPCKIKSGDGSLYIVDVYENGLEHDATVENVVMQIPQMYSNTQLSPGEIVIGFPTLLKVLNN